MFTLLITIALIGLLVWVVTNFIPMEPRFKQLFVVVAIVLTLLWILQGFGVLPFSFHNFKH